MSLRGAALVPGSCGEIVQGTCSGRNFLVSCPVNWYSRVTVSIERGIKTTVYPPGCFKAARAVRLMLDALGCPEFGAVVTVSSSLPVGKGMASSTADIAAACYAVAAALGSRPEPERVAEIALSIEPTDGTFSPGITLFDHVRGRVFEVLGSPPSMGILAVDFGGEVDTLEFNRRPDLPYLNRLNEPELAKALALVRLGIEKGDPWAVGEGATISALANQRILPKPGLEELIEFATRIGAYGVNVAHSGTVAGILLPPGRERNPHLIGQVRQRFPEIKAHYPLRLTEGGPRYPGNVRCKTGEKKRTFCKEAPARGRSVRPGGAVWSETG